MRTFGSVDELAGAVGEVIGPGPWHTVDQHRVDLFAEATGDHQWIHTDPGRAAAGPFAGTVAHGYLTLSLLPALARDLYRVDGVGMAVNYGLNRVRFPAPVRTGAAVRLTAQILAVEAVTGGVQLVVRATVDTDAGGKPACVAETVSRLYR
jgi:acyl dehydratase